VYASQVSPSPAPSVPELGPAVPPGVDLTWVFTGFGAVVCFALALMFLFMLIRNRTGHGDASPWALVAGMAVAIAGMFILGAICTNTMWEPLRPLAAAITGPGVVVVLIALVLLAISNS
jgi:hypothetical protein